LIRHNQPKLGTLKLRDVLKKELKKCPRGLGRDKFFDLLRANELLIKPRRRYAVTTNSKHMFYKYGNELIKTEIDAPHKAWVSDITYLNTKDKFVYLSLVTDVFSRKIVGWSLDVSLAVEGAMNALRKAIKQCPDTKHLLHHSDRGIQYCCYAYTGLLKSKDILISMGEAGNCYDNAIAERMNGILKDEYLLNTEFKDYDAALRAVEQAVYFYNNERPHWSLGLDRPARVHERGAYRKGFAFKRWGGGSSRASQPIF
jgi:putative transposase